MQNVSVGAFALLVLVACTRENSAPPAAATSAGTSGTAAASATAGTSAEPRASAGTNAGPGGMSDRPAPAAAGSGTGGRTSASAGQSGSTPAADASIPDAMAGAGGAGGMAGSGGRAGSGGQAGSEGRAGSMAPVASGPYQCDAKLAANPIDPGGDGAEGSECCAGAGSCQRRGAITLELKASLGHDSCMAGSDDDDLRCVPTATMHGGVCHAQTGGAALEGRCFPRCLLAGNPEALLLTTTDCGGDEAQVCAACFDPVSGQATGACTSQPGDRPNEPAPAPYKECGSYSRTNDGPMGVCMPRVLATASGNPVAATLPQDICADSEVCMPKLKAADFYACFRHCETSALVQAAGSKEGGCIPPYIAQSANPEAVTFLERGVCSEGELCAPCLDPTKDFAVSGACE